MNVADEIALYAAVVFHPNDDDVVEVRRLRGDDGRSTWHWARDLAGVADDLARENADGWNCYCGTNTRTNFGKRGNKNVVLARTLFADFDGMSLSEAWRRWTEAGLPVPSMVLWSGHGVHCYLRLSEPLWDLAGWTEWQKDLAALVGSDPVVSNPERIMRLPGLRNHKPPAADAELLSHEPDLRYHLSDLDIPMREGSNALPPVYKVRVRRRREGKSIDFSSVERAGAYLAKCPNAVSGNHGHTATWYAANICNRFGLSKDEALEVMGEFNVRCSPPWSEKELLHKLDDAYRRNANEHGVKGAAA